MNKKIAVITGASSGIGLLSAVEMAKTGIQVVASMRDLARRTKLDEAAAAAGVALDVCRFDVTEFGSTPSFVEKVVRDHGRIDVLVNNAGFAVAGFAEDIKLDELRRQFETNFFAQVALTQAVIPTMRRQRSGHILMMSSIGGLAGAMSISSYNASKFALEGWSECLRLELSPLGIKVVLIEPGSYQTDIWTRNVLMAEKVLDGTSPNRARGERMRDRVQQIKKRDPIDVARLVARVANDPNPRLRYLIGPDAHIQLWMKRLLPWKWNEKLIAGFMKVDE
jgi:NAD(P)-dependent dehydrogenase (short-subunit alcohol dehydrogenase family)